MNKYGEQSRNNIICFLEDHDYRERRVTFELVVKELQKRNLSWALGCSMNLFFRGIVDDFNDIDIITNETSIKDLKETLEGLGAVLVGTGGNGYCESDYYYHFQLGRVDIDVISGFRILTYNSQYYYCYKKQQLDYFTVTDKLSINLYPLEAMYILYYMMEGWQPRRKFKRDLIQKFLENQEVLLHRDILEEALTISLPSWIRWDIKNLITK